MFKMLVTAAPKILLQDLYRVLEIIVEENRKIIPIISSS